MTKSNTGKIATKTGKETRQPKTANSSAAAVSCGHDQQQPANPTRTIRAPSKRDHKGKHPLSVVRRTDAGTHVSATSAPASSHAGSLPAPPVVSPTVGSSAASAAAVKSTAQGKTKLLKKGSRQHKRASLTTASAAAGLLALAGSNDALKEKLADKVSEPQSSGAQPVPERKPLFDPSQIFGKETVPQEFYIPPDYKVVKTVKIEAPAALRQIYDSYPDHTAGFNAVVKYLRQQTALSQGDAPEELFYRIADSILPQDQRDLVHRATKLSKAPVALVTVRANPWSVSYWLNALKIADWKGDMRYYQLLGYACGVIGGLSLSALTVVIRRFSASLIPLISFLPAPVQRVIRTIADYTGAMYLGGSIGLAAGCGVALAYTAHCYTRPHGIRPTTYTFSPIIANGISARVAGDASLRSVVQDGGVQATRIYSCINIPADILADVRMGSVQNAVEKRVEDTPAFLNFMWDVLRPVMTKTVSDLASVLSFRRTCFASKSQDHTFTQVYPIEKDLPWAFPSTYPMSRISAPESPVSSSSVQESPPICAQNAEAPTVITELPAPASPMTAQQQQLQISSTVKNSSGPPDLWSSPDTGTESSDSDSDSDFVDASGEISQDQTHSTFITPALSSVEKPSSGPPPASQ